jgi:hypothetical protein
MVSRELAVLYVQVQLPGGGVAFLSAAICKRHCCGGCDDSMTHESI